MLHDFKNWDDRPSEFASEKFKFIRRLNGKTCRTVCVLFNEGPSAFEEVAEACSLGFPVICMKGSGGLADRLASAQESDVGSEAECPEVQKLVASRCLYVFDTVEGRNCDLASLIRCHCLTDLVNMTRLLSDLGPVESPVESAIDFVFKEGQPVSKVRSRVGAKGKLKVVNFDTRDNMINRNSSRQRGGGNLVADMVRAEEGNGAGGGELDIELLFASWDRNNDGSLSMLEIIQGLRFGDAKLPALMVARIQWVLEELINQGQDPDWDYLGLDEFQNLLTARPSAETTDTSYFLEKYGNISLSEQLLPDVSLLDFKNSTTAREEKTSLGTDAGKRRKNINSVPEAVKDTMNRLKTLVQM